MLLAFAAGTPFARKGEGGSKAVSVETAFICLRGTTSARRDGYASVTITLTVPTTS